MSSPIERMIDDVLSCTKCGTKGFMKCDCYEQCSCGWIADKGQPCRNPETTRCSTKVKHSEFLRKQAKKEREKESRLYEGILSRIDHLR